MMVVKKKGNTYGKKADSYQVRKLNPRKEYLIQVPGSKKHYQPGVFLLAALSSKKSAYCRESCLVMIPEDS